MGSSKRSLNAKGRIRRKGTGKGGGKGTGKGSGKGANCAGRMKRLEAKQRKAPKVATDIRLTDDRPDGDIFAGVLIPPPKPYNVDHLDIDDDEAGMFDLDFTKPDKEDDVHSDDEDLAEDDRDDNSQVWIIDDLDLDGPDDDLDLNAPNVLSTPSRESSAIRRLKKAQHLEEQKPYRSAIREGYVALPACQNTDEILAWWTETFDVFEAKCLRDTARKTALDAYRTILDAILRGGVFTSAPLMSMRVVCDLGRQHLYAGMLRAVEGDSKIRIYLITIIAGHGLTSHAQTHIDLGQSQAREQAFLRDVSPNYFAVTEFALFNSHGYPGGGQMLQRHTHALVLLREGDPDPKVAIAKHLKKFEPNFTGIPVIDVRPVDTDTVNLARIAAYMFKAPSRCKSWREAKDGKRSFINNSEAGDRPSRYLRLAQIRSMLSRRTPPLPVVSGPSFAAA
jgi:hypothetical protein